MAKFNLFVKQIKENRQILNTFRNLIESPALQGTPMLNSSQSTLRMHISFSLQHFYSENPLFVEKWEISTRKNGVKKIRMSSMDTICSFMLEILGLMNSLVVLKNVAHDELVVVNFHVGT